jgi:hypothetical protein
VSQKSFNQKNYTDYNEKECHWALVAHTYNPSYSGGKDQEDRGSKPAWTNSL